MLTMNPPVPALARTSRRVNLYACLALVLVNLIWISVIRLPYLQMDDGIYIMDNPYIKAGLTWKTVKWAFTNTEADFWFPLTWLSLALDSTLFGIHSWASHGVNVFLHVVNTLLVYAFFRRIGGTWGKCLFAAALFAIHPQRVESLAWACERKDVLAGLFGLLTLHEYVWYAGPDGRRTLGRYLLVGFFYLCSMLSKSMLVTLPALLLVLDYYPLRRWERGKAWQLVREKIPFLVFSLAISLDTMLIQTAAGGLANTLPQRLVDATLSYFFYVRDFFYVGHLSLIYGPWKGVAPWQVAGAGLFTLAVTALAIYLGWWRAKAGDSRQDRSAEQAFLAGWLWYLIITIPMSGIVQSGYNIRADRFTYFPVLGLIWALVWGVAPLLKLDRLRTLSVAGGVLIVAVFAGLSLQRAALWRDPLVLMEHDLQFEPNNSFLEENAGMAAENERKWDRAMMHYRRAAAIEPLYKNLPYEREVLMKQLATQPSPNFNP